MTRIAVACAVVAIIVSSALIAATSTLLPPQVASHFVEGGAATGFQTRIDYTLVMLALAITPPLSIMVLAMLLPRVAPAAINLPGIRRWLASPRRDEALATIDLRGAIGAIIFTAMIAAIHLVLLAANLRAPPRLDAVALGVVVGAFGLLMLAWVAELCLRFRRAP